MAGNARWANLAIGVPGDGREPFLRFVGFACRQLGWRIEGTGRTALGLHEDVVPGLIDTGKRKAVTGSDDVVANAGEFWWRRRLAGEQADDHAGTGFALRACG